MSLKIDKGIALPKASTGRTSKYVSTFQKMDVGDSFLVKGTCGANNVRGRINKHLKNLKMKAAIRKVDNGVRVWRVA